MIVSEFVLRSSTVCGIVGLFVGSFIAIRLKLSLENEGKLAMLTGILFYFLGAIL